jgi:hypothetical protein
MAFGQTFNVAGFRLYRDREIAEHIAGMVGAGSKVSLVKDAGQGMISVSVEKLSKCIGYCPRRGDFLREFIETQFV